MTTNSLLQTLLIGFAGVSLALYCIRTVAGKGQRLHCPPGGNATVDGAVVRGGKDMYLVEGKSGQILRVAIKSLEDNAVFTIRVPGGKSGFLPGAGGGDEAMSWQGALVRDGSYQIVVYPVRGKAMYALRVELFNEPERRAI
jgi:hypothetical protein